MVAVAQHQSRKIAVFHCGRVFRTLIRIGIAQVAIFSNHQNAEAIAKVEQFRSHRIVRETETVATHFLEPFEPPLEQPIRHRHTHTRMVLVTVDALYFY